MTNLKSVIVFGNGITMDTYGEKNQKIEKIYLDTIFYKTDEGVAKDKLFSERFYPDLVEYSNKKNETEFYLIGRILNDIFESNPQKEPEKYWEKVIVFNSFREYLYKLFWHYNRMAEKCYTNNSGINLFSKLVRQNKKEFDIINLNYDLVVEKHLERNKIKISYSDFQMLQIVK